MGKGGEVRKSQHLRELRSRSVAGTLAGVKKEGRKVPNAGSKERKSQNRKSEISTPRPGMGGGSNWQQRTDKSLKRKKNLVGRAGRSGGGGDVTIAGGLWNT